MADYKIANIKWLRDQGWEISSSYASSLCPTYNEIVNEIPKGSITVDVNRTCIATSKAYSNNQLVCESDITIGPAVDCSAYNFDDLTPGMAHTSFERIPIAQSNYNKEQLSWTINDNWITDVAVSSYEPAPGAICWRYVISAVANPTTDERNGSVTFTSTDGCSFTGHCTQAGKAVDCSVYGWTGTTEYEGVRDNVGGPVGISLASAGTLVLYDKPSWVTYITANTSQDVIAYICKAEDSDGRRRSGDVVFRSPDGNCEFSGTVIQAAQATAVHLTFTGLPSNLSSGGLSMTGSTYTAEFTLAVPNAGNGTLYGIFSPSDSRQAMTFSGQFTTSSGGGGGSIYNECSSYQRNIYIVYTASWNATTRTLNVTFGACS